MRLLVFPEVFGKVAGEIPDLLHVVRLGIIFPGARQTVAEMPAQMINPILRRRTETNQFIPLPGDPPLHLSPAILQIVC